MRKELILPPLALAGGLAGFLLRRRELATAFEPDTGLAIWGTPATYGLIALSLGMILLLTLLCRTKADFPDGADQAFAAKGNTLYAAGMVCAALLAAAAGVLILMSLPAALDDALGRDLSTPYLTVLPLALFGGLALVSGGCLFRLGRNYYRGEGKAARSTVPLMPAYTCCLWLIVAYQVRSGDPVLLDYVWELLAVMAVLLATYFLAGFSFGRGKAGRTLVFCLFYPYLALVTLADPQSPAHLMLTCAMMLYTLCSAVVLLHHCQGPQGPRMPREEAEPQTETIIREETSDEG